MKFWNRVDWGSDGKVKPVVLMKSEAEHTGMSVKYVLHFSVNLCQYHFLSWDHYQRYLYYESIFSNKKVSGWTQMGSPHFGSGEKWVRKSSETISICLFVSSKY